MFWYGVGRKNRLEQLAVFFIWLFAAGIAVSAVELADKLRVPDSLPAAAGSARLSGNDGLPLYAVLRQEAGFASLIVWKNPDQGGAPACSAPPCCFSFEMPQFERRADAFAGFGSGPGELFKLLLPARAGPQAPSRRPVSAA